MPLDTPAMGLARNHLEAAIGGLEGEAAGGRFNTLCIRALGGAATLLGHQAVAERAIRLLHEAPDEVFWLGAITNIELPEIVPEGLRQIDSPEMLENEHPPYRKENSVEQARWVAESAEHVALCLDGRFQDARRKAGSGRQLEEVGLTLAILEEFDAALNVARDPALEDFRRKNVLFVLALELFRSGRVEESRALLAELKPANWDAWGQTQLALGLAGRVPWGGYPYPDW